MDLLSSVNHAVNESELRPGDHIYCYRQSSYSSYAHHGIFMGNGKVVHFLDNSGGEGGEGSSSSFPMFSSSRASSSKSRCAECASGGKGGVQIICLKCFLNVDTLRRFHYGVSKAQVALNLRGGSSGIRADDPALVLHRADYLLKTNGFGKYNLQIHNCEDFAIYCKTGVIDMVNGMSKQVEILQQLAKSFRGQRKFDPMNIVKKLKTHLVDERMERDQRGTRIEVEELVRMYEQNRR